MLGIDRWRFKAITLARIETLRVGGPASCNLGPETRETESEGLKQQSQQTLPQAKNQPGARSLAKSGHLAAWPGIS